MNNKTTLTTITVDFKGTPVTANIDKYTRPNGDITYLVSTEQYDGFTAVLYSEWSGKKPPVNPSIDDLKSEAFWALINEIHDQGGLNYLSK